MNVDLTKSRKITFEDRLHKKTEVLFFMALFLAGKLRVSL